MIDTTADPKSKNFNTTLGKLWLEDWNGDAAAAESRGICNYVLQSKRKKIGIKKNNTAWNIDIGRLVL